MCLEKIFVTDFRERFALHNHLKGGTWKSTPENGPGLELDYHNALKFLLISLYVVQSSTWTDSEDDTTSVSIDLSTAMKRIKSLEAKLGQAKRDLAEYQHLVRERLTVE